jgi:hypothetical protein
MKWVAIGIGVFYAFAGKVIAQHDHVPSNLTPEQECAQECHNKHCDQWTACYSAADPVKCQAETNQKEAECIKQCSPPRG